MLRILLFICASIFFMSGCSDTTNNIVYTSGKSSIDTNAMYFIEGYDSIKYMNFETGDVDFFCYDPLCTHDLGECPARIRNGAEMIFSLSCIRENCIWYVRKAADLSHEEPIIKYQIVEYDATSRKTSVIVDGATDLITQFVVRGDVIYYFMNGYGENGNWIRNIYQYSLNNRKSICLTENIEEDVLFLGYDGEDVLLQALELGLIYKTDWSFSNWEILKRFEKSHTNSFTHDGYLYYYINEDLPVKKEWTRIVDGNTMKTDEKFYYNFCPNNLVRIPLSLPDAEPEYVMYNVISTSNIKIYDNQLICIEYAPQYFRSSIISDDEDPKQFHDLFTQGGSVYSVDLQTLESKMIVPFNGFDTYSVYYWDNNKIVFKGRYLELENTDVVDNNRFVVYQYDFNNTVYSILSEG